MSVSSWICAVILSREEGRHLPSAGWCNSAEMCLVRDVITVGVETMYAQVSDFDPDVGRVLFRYGAEKLFGQPESLSDMLEQPGGRAEFAGCRKQTRAPSKQEATHVGA